MRVISDAIGLDTEDFTASPAIKNTNSLYSGFATILVDDEFIDQFYENEKVFLERTTTQTISESICNACIKL
jgi:predicted ribonuclease YlaK